jgi:F0F1-type ATP synthase delta subunit
MMLSSVRHMASKRVASLHSRGFADAAAPVKLHGISGRYATALYTVAGAKSKFIVGSELEGLMALRKDCQEFDTLLSDPTIQDSIKLPAIDAVLAKGGYSDPIKKFFGVQMTHL